MHKIKRIPIVCLSLVNCGLLYAQSVVAATDTSLLRSQDSKLFVFYSGNKTLDDYIARAKSNKGASADQPIILSRSMPREGSVGENPNENSREAYILSETANSDLVVVAEPFLRNSAPTEGGRFIFSDYEVAVDRIIFTRDVAILPGQKIVVTRPGGTVQYRGRTVIGSLAGFKPFVLNEPYMIFLRLLPNGSFLVVGEAAYNMANERVSIQNKQKTHQDGTIFLVTKDQFVEDVERAAKRLGRIPE